MVYEMVNRQYKMKLVISGLFIGLLPFGLSSLFQERTFTIDPTNKIQQPLKALSPKPTRGIASIEDPLPISIVQTNFKLLIENRRQVNIALINHPLCPVETLAQYQNQNLQEAEIHQIYSKLYFELQSKIKQIRATENCRHVYALINSGIHLETEMITR